MADREPTQGAGSPDGQLVVVGEVMGAHGTAGDLRVKVHNPESTLLLESEALVLVQDGARRDIRVLSAQPHGKGLRMRVEGVVGRAAARALYGAELCIPRERLPPLEDNEYYLVDLVGTCAYLEDGSEVGPVVGYLLYPSADVLQIKTATGVVELPMMEPYLVDVQAADGRITVGYLDDLRDQGRK